MGGKGVAGGTGGAGQRLIKLYVSGLGKLTLFGLFSRLILTEEGGI